ncbi:dysbindin-like [Salminus brasiliensis]|uniref:dysbindin-like n=1 Tax=Salminus brasiliensis TaxID=930266 RepID=UPI003B82F224
MSTSGATNQNKPLSSGTDYPQRGLEMETTSVKLRERQRFFEEVFQHDVDNYLSANHLHFDSKKPPMGSISSMEVNVDILEQMDLMEISDHEALDVFLNSGNDNSTFAPSQAEEDDEDELEDDEDSEVLFRPVRQESKSRTSSTSSRSDQDNSASGRDTPVVQSDEEEVQVDNFLLTSTTMPEHEEEEEEEEEKPPEQLS